MRKDNQRSTGNLTTTNVTIEQVAEDAPGSPYAVLINGDCRTELAKVASDSVDLIVTSPPYADQRATTYGGIKPDNYVAWFLPIADELQRVLKPTGSFVLNIKEPAINGERHPLVMEIIFEMRRRGWLWTEEFAWHKKNCYPGKWPNRFRDAWERLLQFNKQRKFKMRQDSVMVPVGDWHISRMKNLSETDQARDESKVGSGFGKKVANWVGRDMVYPTNVLHGATECGNRNHSAVFPYWLPEWFINLFTDPGDTVLDPFMGSGTTAFAALMNGRNVVGIEVHEPYYQELRERLNEEYEVREVQQPINAITDEQITKYVEDHIGTYHANRLNSLRALSLKGLLLRKNPYLFRNKNLLSAGEIVKSLLDAYLSSQEETMFGDFLEGLAIYIAENVHGGVPSGIPGVDLEFSKGGSRHIVSIKSGPNWGNSNQIKRMRQDFRAAGSVLRQRPDNPPLVFVNGCCYGRDESPDKGDYFKYCGQRFWELISNDPGLYTRIIEPLGHKAGHHDNNFNRDYGAVITRFATEFTREFCDPDGYIDWEKLVRYGSATTPLLAVPAEKRSVNRLLVVGNVVDTLNGWGYHELSETLAGLLPQVGAGNTASDAVMNSLRGLVMFIGTVHAANPDNVIITDEGLFRVEWILPEGQEARVTFSDIDHVSVEASDSEGSRMRIGNRNGATRHTAITRLVENHLFVRRVVANDEADIE